MTARDRVRRLASGAAPAFCAALAVGATLALAPGAPSAEAQIVRVRTMEDDAALFFGPSPSPYYDAAEAIQSGEPIGDAALAAVKPDIDRRFQEGDFTLLNFAWRVGNVKALEQLIDHGSDWRQPSMTHGPMAKRDLFYEAAITDQPISAEVIRILLGHGLDPNERETLSGEPILSEALLGRGLGVEQALVEAGADPWAETRAGDRRPMVQLAFESGQYEFLRWLIVRGVFDAPHDRRVRDFLRLIAQAPRDVPAELARNRVLARAITDRAPDQRDRVVESLMNANVPHESR